MTRQLLGLVLAGSGVSVGVAALLTVVAPSMEKLVRAAIAAGAGALVAAILAYSMGRERAD
jgi:hypothetical protein